MNRFALSTVVCLALFSFVVAVSPALADLPTFMTIDNRLPTPQVPYSLAAPPADFGPSQMITLYSLDLQAKNPDQVEAPVFDSGSGRLTLDSFFDVTYRLELSIGLGPVFPVFGDGQMHVVGQNAFIPNLFVTLYDLELTQLDLFPPATDDSVVPVMLRESPTAASTGQITLIDTCPACAPPFASYQVTSFFDVFAEISIDGGSTWTPSNGSFRIVQGLPEPSTWTIAALALTLAGRRRRRQTS